MKNQDKSHLLDCEYETESIDLRVRVAEVTDARAVIAAIEQIREETEFLTLDEGRDTYAPQKQCELIQTYRQSPNSIMLVAEVDDQIIGLANLAEFPGNRQKHIAELGIGMVEEYWGYGIGTIILQSLLEFAQNSGLEMITLEVVDQNQRAIALYERFGFKTVGHLNKRLKVGDSYFNSLMMELEVD